MAAWADRLADRFSWANDELIAVAEACSEARWRACCVAEGWPVGVVVHHVAEDYVDVLAVVEAIATGRPAPAVTRESLDQRNARHASEFARCTKEETLALLRRNGTAVADAIRRLSQEELARTATVLGRDVSAAQLMEPVLVDHIRNHLDSIRSTISGRRRAGWGRGRRGGRRRAG